MFSRSRLYFSVLMVMSIAFTTSSAQSADVRAKIREATHGFKDVTITAKVLYTNHDELKKIGKDFPRSYEFKSTTVWYKAPDKMRIEGKLGLVKVAMIMSDHYKMISVPSIRYSKKEDISDDPHKRQTDFDLGIITESIWQDYSVVDIETEGSSANTVYKITFIRDNARNKKHIAWVDTDTLKLLKVEKYESNGDMKSRYIFCNHTQIDGVWVPRKVDVYSPSGKLAATSGYENIKVNTDLPDSLFKM